MPLQYPVLSTLVRTQIRLFNLIQQRLRIDYDMTAGQYEALRQIDEIDACRVGDIARRLVISVGATSRTVDSLETAGWVTRRPNPQNRRSSLLGLTDAGRATLVAATDSVEDELAPWLNGISVSQRDQLMRSMSEILVPLEAAGAGQPTG